MNNSKTSLRIKLLKLARWWITNKRKLQNILGNLKRYWLLVSRLIVFFIKMLMKRDWVRKQKWSWISWGFLIIPFQNMLFTKELLKCIAYISYIYIYIYIYIHIYILWDLLWLNGGMGVVSSAPFQDAFLWKFSLHNTLSVN